MSKTKDTRFEVEDLVCTGQHAQAVWSPNAQTNNQLRQLTVTFDGPGVNLTIAAQSDTAIEHHETFEAGERYRLVLTHVKQSKRERERAENEADEAQRAADEAARQAAADEPTNSSSVAANQEPKPLPLGDPADARIKASEERHEWAIAKDTDKTEPAHTEAPGTREHRDTTTATADEQAPASNRPKAKK